LITFSWPGSIPRSSRAHWNVVHSRWKTANGRHEVVFLRQCDPLFVMPGTVTPATVGGVHVPARARVQFQRAWMPHQRELKEVLPRSGYFSGSMHALHSPAPLAAAPSPNAWVPLVSGPCLFPHLAISLVWWYGSARLFLQRRSLICLDSGFLCLLVRLFCPLQRSNNTRALQSART
jgi:hypothetical protein